MSDGRHVILIVNGNDVAVPFREGDRLGVLAHRALARDGYDWETFELRDEAGRLVSPGVVPISGERVWVTRPIGWGG